ncbi:hypothetical protein L3081_12860 [Colwellia sp. MSW7]|uniref:23S rRNA (guanine(745)-N(1))-methyltransferase N-terminal domain-containing protein n=1 Tax=Colwellia maritima TaxID=2912588 RepID=A0ABS9X1Q5_9GAMM|nr:hypothetical protein [Colwellia maritima]MCI2284110.1 hypothetical protein [Colwellia maritima]
MSELENYLCPLCQQALILNDNTYRCINNHSFDRAKQGYVNLLPVQFKHSKAPGDNKDMVNARRAFLDKGFYQPLVDKMFGAIPTIWQFKRASIRCQVVVKVFIHINIKQVQIKYMVSILPKKQ